MSTFECLGCNLIELHPVTLCNGKVVCSSCEAWRKECEARFALKNKPRTYLARIREKRGEKAYEELRQAMYELKGFKQ